jgi:hypothetical protein
MTVNNPRCPWEHLSSLLNLGVARIAWRVAGGAAEDQATRCSLMLAGLPSGHCRLLVAGRLVVPLLDGGADSGMQPGVTALAILNIQRLNYLWTIRHSSARIAGNLIT